jgi:hypothetical protein
MQRHHLYRTRTCILPALFFTCDQAW